MKSIGKTVFGIFLLLCVAETVSCGKKEPQSSSSTVSEVGVACDKKFWGLWNSTNGLKMYISSRSVRIDSLSPFAISITEAADDHISAGYYIEYLNDNLIKYNYGIDNDGNPAEAYLYRGSRTIDFSGKMVSFNQTISRIIARGIGLGGLGGVSAILQNIENEDDKHIVTTDQTGGFEVTGGIPGSIYKVGDTLIDPLRDGDDVGMVVMNDSESGYNFKMSMSTEYGSSHFIWSDMIHGYFTVLVRNDGKIASPGATYKITTGPLFTLNMSDSGSLATISPGGVIQLSFDAAIKAITGSYQDEFVQIDIVDGNKTWSDRRYLRIYNSMQRNALVCNSYSVGSNVSDTRVWYMIMTPGWDPISGVAEAGAILLPSAMLTNDTYFMIQAPSTDAKYIIYCKTDNGGSPNISYNLSTMTIPVDTYENDNSQLTATVLNGNTEYYSYISRGDVDFFRLNRY